uniref:Uncharacterized protein n=1 Tax=Echeneis naucrates TaxID=173247 RepID=A0A665VDT7_ECHNA
MGNAEGSPNQRPIPAKALLSTDNNHPSEDTNSSCQEYSWQIVGVLDYSKEKRQYLVQKVTDEEGNPNLNEGHKDGANPLLPGTKHWVPRIRLLFFAEDPHVFVERLQYALCSRENTEALIFYHLCVDCMPIWEKTPSVDSHSLKRIKKRALSAPGLGERDLEKDIKLDYDCTMNRMIFDKIVMRNPDKFSHITLPKKDPEYVPQNGKLVCLEHICTKALE